MSLALHHKDLLSIGEVGRRSGLAPSALRHYESIGLIASHRTDGDRRVFERGVLRRLAVIRAGQRVGLSLGEIRESFDSIDPHQAPSRRDWRRISARWQPLLEPASVNSSRCATTSRTVSDAGACRCASAASTTRRTRWARRTPAGRPAVSPPTLDALSTRPGHRAVRAQAVNAPGSPAMFETR